MFERRTLLALAVVGLILLLLPQYYKLIAPDQPTHIERQQAVTPVDTTEKRPDTMAAPKDQTKVAQQPVMGDTTQITPPQVSTGPDTAALVPEYVNVETPLYRLKFGSNAMVSYYGLTKYNLDSGDPVELHRVAETGLPLLGAVDFDLGPRSFKSLTDLRFRANKHNLNVSGGVDSVTFERTDAEGHSVWLTYIFFPDRYGFDVRLRSQGLPTTETGEFKARWVGGVPYTESDPARDVTYSAAYAKVGEELEKVSLGGDKTKEFTATGQTHFVAARSKYFMAALVPQDAAAGADLRGYSETPKLGPNYFDCTLRHTWGENAAGYWTVYWGPIRLQELKAVHAGLDETMNWGWPIIRPFSRLTLWALTGLYGVIRNYGFVIVIFSILVKVILWPLTRKSQVSMKKMSALQPEMARIREDHKKNPQAANVEIMKLYKERGVNPAAGCIPLVIQMPILYGLFVIFSSTIEFRHAPFMLWIQDLSRPDYVAHLPFSLPLYGAYVAVLPIIMGISQFFMGKRTVTDPNQKMMLYFMPVFMLLIFNKLPSGLTLYYTLFNLLAIVEQRLIKVPELGSVEVVEEKKKKG
jgi:YidC/Oxa1 family membrane protein insertase